MDFGEFAGKALKFTGKAVYEVGKFLVNEAIDTVKDTQRNYDKMGSYDDRKLRDTFSSGSFTERAAARKHLKDSGYSDEELREMMRKN